ncbi:MAG: GAF domain-containing protein [Anaerolineae bacterium]|nr:GAF domain-containing protein [Anaerolineae bacterium]
MKKLLNRLFPLSIYRDPLDRRRAFATYLIGAFLCVGVGLAGMMILGAILTRQDIQFEFGLTSRGIILLITGVGAVILTARRQQTLGGLLIVSSWYLLLAPLGILGQLSVTLTFAAGLVGISFAAFIVHEWGVIIGAVATFALLLLTAFTNPGTEGTTLNSILFSQMGTLMLHTAINFFLARSLRTVGKEIAARLEESSTRLAAVSGVLAQQLLAARLELSTLLERTVKLVRDSFPGINEAQLFLVDKDRRNATLVASTNAAGLSALGQKVGVGSLNVIGRVTISGQSVLVRDTPEEQQYRRSAFLEGTQSELVLPLRVGNDIIGALDLQSMKPEAFAEDETEVLETIANQIAVAIDNALLYADAQEKARENQRLYEQASTSLREIERLNQELMGGAWTEYLRGNTSAPAYTIEPTSGRVEDAAERTGTMMEAMRRNQTITRANQTLKTVTLPINVHGQVIGAMEFELDPDQNISNEQMTLLRQVVERLGLAAENMRLLEEAQRIAQREATVNEITARMQAATSVEAVVATAAQSLADAFQAPRVSIRLGVPNRQNGNKGA